MGNRENKLRKIEIEKVQAQEQEENRRRKISYFIGKIISGGTKQYSCYSRMKPETQDKYLKAMESIEKMK